MIAPLLAGLLLAVAATIGITAVIMAGRGNGPAT